MIEHLTSAKNPRVLAWRSLKERKGRLAHEAFLAEGDRMAAEALASGFPVEALLLRYRHGCSIRELAELYGIQYGAAQRMLHRAKQALRQELEKGEQGE